MIGRAPIQVAVIDVGGPIPDLDGSRQVGPSYTGVWILACRGRDPLGTLHLPFDGASLRSGVIERELRSRFGEAYMNGQPAQGATSAAVLPRATVIVPTAVSRSEQLRRCVARLAELDYPSYDVIVVDNRPEGVPITLSGAEVVREPRPGISAARNRGLRAATGEIVAFTDDDVEVDRTWLRAIGERFAHEPGLAAVTGLVVPAELETEAQVLFEQSGSGPDRVYAPLEFSRAGRFQITRRSPRDGGERVVSIYATGELGLGSNMAFRSTILRELGGFDVALGAGTPTHGGEDLEVLVRLLMTGHRVAYEPSAIVHHTHRAQMAELERQIRGYGSGFTAMLTALALRDPRHVLGLASVLPAWLRSLRSPSSAKRVNRTADYPPGLERGELRGMLIGPARYLQARWRQRRWRA